MTEEPVPLTSHDIAQLYRSQAQAMVTYFARRTYDPEAAVDLVAETFALALRDARKWRGSDDEDAAAWTWGIARHPLSRWDRRGAVERRALARLGVERRELSDPEYERIVELGGLAETRRRVAA